MVFEMQKVQSEKRPLPEESFREYYGIIMKKFSMFMPQLKS